MAAAASEIRLRALLGAGYFPPELPPPFTTRGYAKQIVAIAAAWQSHEIISFRSAPEHYSIPRYAQVRRKLSIVNPVNQYLVSKIIATNWDDIKARLDTAHISEFRPKITTFGGGRAVPGVNFDGVARRRAEILAKFGRYLKTDIARFYPSIYTHSITWAVLGKDWCK